MKGRIISTRARLLKRLFAVPKIRRTFTLKDFADHGSDWVEPITANYRGYNIHEMPPATQGFVALEMLKILEGFELKALGPGSAAALHLMIEAKKLAFMDRDRQLADRDHMKVSVNGLLAQARVEKLRRQIQKDRAANEYQSISAGTDTEYVAAADSDGNLVSFIQSNFMGFGSGVVEPETGIVLQIADIFSRWIKRILIALGRTNAACTRSCPE